MILLDWLLNFNLFNLTLLFSNSFFKGKGKSFKSKKFLSGILVVNNNL